jgi:hypothetical protein
MRTYRFNEPPSRDNVFGPLPGGDYSFVVTDCQEPYQSQAGNWVLPIKLAIEPQGIPVFANPWSGVTKDGEERDGIAEFLLSCNRAPEAGEEPDWPKVIGARGTCRLKIKIAQKGNLAGKEVNKVAFFHRPQQVGPERPIRSRPDMGQYKKSQPTVTKKPDDDPDDIPF